MIFLDEYDTPLQEAYVCGYWDELAALIRGLFNSTFKTNPYMERPLMTGITRVSKESVFSDLKNLMVITTTSELYQDQFGFTQEEVSAALREFEMENESDQVRNWYDGFTFGSRKDIYNPWSITQFLKEKQYKPYWANTSSHRLVSMLIRQGNPETKMIAGDLLEGKAFHAAIDEEIVFNQLQRTRGALWSMMLASGYLKVNGRSFDSRLGEFTYELELTNREVKMLFRKMLQDWFSGENVPYNAFVRALLSGDVRAMNQYMNRVAEETFSFFDAGNRPSGKSEPERFYHGFVLGLVADLNRKYRITSNRESGFGRYDVMMEPYQNNETAFILEFKVFDSKMLGSNRI